MENNAKNITESQNVVQLLSNDEVELQFGEAIASVVARDQVVTWAKLILTDDKPNRNKQRIPAEEFDNIIRTSQYKPVKMADGEIKDGHEDARPLGVITNVTKDGDKLVALVALWDHEREDDVATVKNLVKAGKPVNVSWELYYEDATEKDGITDLLGVVLRAVTIVGMPAYAGRTQFLAVAAVKKWSDAYIAKLPDSNFLHVDANGNRYFAYRDDTGKIDPNRFPVLLDEASKAPLPENTLKGIRHQVKRLQTVVSTDASILELIGEGEDFITEEQTLDTKELEGKLSEVESKLASANDVIASKEKELVDALAAVQLAEESVKTLQEELNPLREFKLEADKAAERGEKLSAVKAKFESLNLVKTDEYFEENADKLLSLDENGIDFMLQEMVAFKEQGKSGEGEASVKKTSGVPNIPGNSGAVTLSELASALRERNRK